ncbi:MAG: GGDEF domain-containing protein [Holophagaceae bacterium]|nr:GGDEF domain-containing protein [Holophagaceae bacterium]
MFAIILVMSIALLNVQKITNTVSKDYARLYSTNTAITLGSHLNNEIALINKVSHSKVVMDWFEDEFNTRKKATALDEILETINELHSHNIYLAINKSFNEYTIGKKTTINTLVSRSKLTPGYFDDEWYFECLKSPNEYRLNVDVDKILNRKLVWINHKVVRNGVPLGVISSGLEFSKLAESLLSKYDSKYVRGVIIDEKGIVQMDSASIGDESFIQYGHGYQVGDEFRDPAFVKALEAYLENIDGYFETPETIAQQLSTGYYNFSTIASIGATNWSVIIFFNSSSLFTIKWLLPMFIGMLAIFIAYAFTIGYVSFRLLFKPIQLLISSLSKVRETKNAKIYGTDRDDEIGSLSLAIKDLLGQVHYDALTGIYNRRFLEENLYTIVNTMIRSHGILSVFMIDIDFFKKYNDTYGHGKGDECLKLVANTLSDSLKRTNDIVARYGGEEFVAVLPYAGESGAMEIANTLIDNVLALGIPHEKNTAADCVSISIGITTAVVTQRLTAKAYLERADEALYKAKQDGRNRYYFLPLD